jgi:hypothetical protein
MTDLTLRLAESPSEGVDRHQRRGGDVKVFCESILQLLRKEDRTWLKLLQNRQKTEDKKPEEKRAATLRPFESLRGEIDRLFDDFEWGWWRSPFKRAPFDMEPFPRGEVNWGKVPAVDVVDTATNYEITAELPGLDEKDIEVKFSDGTLTIRGEKNEEKEEKRKRGKEEVLLYV